MALTKVSSNLVADDAIVTGKIADGGVDTADLAANAVTTAKIAQNNVTAHHIADGSVTVTQLGADAVTAAKVADDAISEEHLDKTIISDMTAVTPVAGDFVLLGDTSDSNNLKKSALTLLLNSNVDLSTKLNLSGGTLTGALVGTSATLTTSATDDPLSLVYTGAAANVGPVLKLYRNSGSPADSDALGEARFIGKNDAAEDVNYAQILSYAEDVSNGTEDGAMYIKTMLAGTARNTVSLLPAAVVINDEGQDVDFRVEGSGSANALFVQGSDGNVGIKTNSPISPLHVKEQHAGLSHGYVYADNGISVESDEPMIQLMATDGGTHGGSLLWRYGANVFAAVANPTTDNLDFIYGVTSADDFDVHAGTNMTSHRRSMSIGADGKVGIGTTSPNRTLSVSTGLAKTSTTTAYPFAIQSNEASGQAQLSIHAIGGASAAVRKWYFQTEESGVANAGEIHLQPHGGTVTIPNTDSGQVNNESHVLIRNLANGNVITDDGLKMNCAENKLTVGGGTFITSGHIRSGAANMVLATANQNPHITIVDANGRIDFGESSVSGQGTPRTISHNSNGRSYITGGAEALYLGGATASESGRSNFRISEGNNNMEATIGGDISWVLMHDGKVKYNNSSTYAGHGNFIGEVGANMKALMFERTNGGGEVGSIVTNASSTTYNTSSDYRLKENVDYTWDATTRLKQLKPARFNWISDNSNTLLEGFLAHEVSSVVPEAVYGTKDGMADAILYIEGENLPEGKSVGDTKVASAPDYQGIDHSKLVPLLVKTVQELEARIATLEG